MASQTVVRAAVTGLVAAAVVGLSGCGELSWVDIGPSNFGPVDGAATATQNPPGSCPQAQPTVSFPVKVEIRGGVLLLTDSIGVSSGTINAAGAAHLSGPSETYDLISSHDTTLVFKETNRGCIFDTNVKLLQPMPDLASHRVQASTGCDPVTLLWLGLIVGGGLALVVGLALWWCACCRRRRRGNGGDGTQDDADDALTRDQVR